MRTIVLALLVILANTNLCATENLGFNLTLDPSGPVALVTPVLILRHRNPTPMVLTCNSRGNYSITWDIPAVLNFGELGNSLVRPNTAYLRYRI